MRATFRRIVIWCVKLAILALVVWGGHCTIVAALDDLKSHHWQLARIQPAWILVAGLFYLVAQIPCAWLWQRVLVALRQPIVFLRALRAFLIGHLGKYVPGKAMVVVLRAALVGGPNVRTAPAVAAVFYETFTTMACGCVVAATILLIGYRGEHAWLILGALGLALLMGVPTIPVVFNRIMRIVPVSRTEQSAPRRHLNPHQILPKTQSI